tara:strand:+ start:72 stop:1523 length:1452 start_codon:yes stop_codon:yes gene_type:complete
MGTSGDIRTLFEMAMNENARTIEGAILPPLQKLLGTGRINSKGGGKDLRFDLGGEDKKSIKKISSAFSKLNQSSIKIEAVAAGEYKDGSNSGKFTTFLITFTKDSKISSINVKAGDVIKIVDNNPPKGSIKSKELTPSALKIPEDTNMQSNKLASIVLGSVKKKFGKSNPFMQSFLTELYNLVSNHKPSYKNVELLELGPFYEKIEYNSNIKEAIDSLGATDLNTIGKDYGEILGAALMLNIVKTTEGISFPSGNNPLVDFHIDGYGISSKYKAGAAPTLSNIIKDLNKDNFTEDSEVKLYDLFKIVESNSVINGYIKGAEFMELPSAIKLKELVGNVPLENKALESFIQDKLKTIGKEEFYKQYVAPLVSMTGRGVKSFESIDWPILEKANRYIGLLSYSLSLELIDKLNGRLGDVDLYTETLKKIVSKLEVKQLYMDVSLKTEEVLFYLKGFGDENANFVFAAPNVSTPNPGNGKLGFKMK